MVQKARQRRSPGQGGCWAYRTKAGVRFRAAGPVILADGTVTTVRKRGFLTQKAGLEWLADAQSAGRRGEYAEPSKQQFGVYAAEVIDGLRVGPQTRASYIKNLRNHIETYPLAAVPLAHLTGAKLTAHYRVLERSGRKDHKAGAGLSPRTVRYLHTIISRVLRQAVKDGLLLRNPAEAATPPSAREAKAPEMTCWSAGQLAAFLAWSAQHSQNHPLWLVLAFDRYAPRRGPGAALARRGPGRGHGQRAPVRRDRPGRRRGHGDHRGRHQVRQAAGDRPGCADRGNAARLAQGTRVDGAPARPR